MEEKDYILDRKQLRELFAKLLESEELWKPYCNHIWHILPEDKHHFPHNGDLNKIFGEWDPDIWIFNAFDWDLSPEKFGRWKALNDRWIEILENN